MIVGSLFTGIGGIDLGLERAGMHVAWQCEIDPYCRRVLERHWTGVACYGDVRGVADPPRVDVLTGGFPCQDVSHIGLRAGIGGEHSGLWTEMSRLVRQLRPRFVLVENVAGLLTGGGLAVVLGDLAASGYDAEWDCLPAAAFGAPHLRARVWLLAYPTGVRDGASQGTVFAGRYQPRDCAWWQAEPDMGRVADGVPDRVDRLRTLGNSVVPQVAEWIGRRMMEAAND